MAVSRRSVDVCKLCLETRPLCDSHVFPEWGYASLYGKKPRQLYRLSGDPEERFQVLQKGLKEPLLCEECETKFSLVENYAKGLLTAPGALTIPTPGTEFGLNQAEYAPFKLFQLSLLWRAHVASDIFFGAVDLGPKHAERLRLMLYNEQPGQPDDYPCAMLAVHLDGEPLRYYMQSPAGRPEAGHRWYVLFYAGFAWQYIVASHKPDDAVAKVALEAGGSFVIGYWEVREFPQFLKTARTVALRNKSDVDRLRAKRKPKTP
jgi:hypothetical protein